MYIVPLDNSITYMEENCQDICIEPALLPLNGRTFQNKAYMYYSVLNKK